MAEIPTVAFLSDLWEQAELFRRGLPLTDTTERRAIEDVQIRLMAAAAVLVIAKRKSPAE